MLLNKADALYFAGSLDSWKDASKLYGRLAKRLAFVDNITVPPDPSKPNEMSQLYKAYSSLQNVSQVTISAIPQLKSVYTQAKARLLQLAAGQDMFGHLPNWCPRLSFFFYQTEVESLLSQLKDLEMTYTSYLDALDKQTSAAESIKSGLHQVQNSLEQAKSRVALLTDANSPLRTSASQINVFTPQLKDRRTKISEDLKKISADIQKNISFDPQSILDAFSMIAVSFKFL